MNYSEFQNQVSSEKITLAILEASKRLMGWALHSGSVYKFENFDSAVVSSIKESGVTLNEVSRVSDVVAGSFYNDRDNRVLYLRVSDSTNPNGKFIHVTFKLFFASSPVTLAHDLNTGYEVYWEPMIASTSVFGVEIDTVNQTSEAIEGSGALTLFNDSEYWSTKFEKYTFENKPCRIYSYHRDLHPTESKLIFSGYVENKQYSPTNITFNLKDLLSKLKDHIPLATVESLVERTSANLSQAKQRTIYGRVFGHRPINLDEVLDGYPLTGTVSINAGSSTLTGSGTSFLSDVSPDDVLVINGRNLTVATVPSNTSLTFTEVYDGDTNLVGVTYKIKPDQPKRYINRRWLVSGHPLRQPTYETRSGGDITRLRLTSTKDIYTGDRIYVGELGSGELVEVENLLSGSFLDITTSLTATAESGTTVFKPAIQNVRLGDLLLQYERDYAFDAETGILTLSEDAEKNASPIRQMANTLSFTNASRTISGTSLTSVLKPGSLVSCVGQASFFEVLSVNSDTQATLRTPATFTATSTGLFKTYIFDPEVDVLTCEVLGKTDDGTTAGNLLDTVPMIVKQCLEDMGLTELIDIASFDSANELAYQKVGIVIPERFNDTASITYRDLFNKLNKSVFGSLVQTEGFQLSYTVLNPRKPATTKKLSEADVLKFTVSSVAEKMIRKAIVSYAPKEYDYTVHDSSISVAEKSSQVSTYLTEIDRERTFETYLVNSADAAIAAARWAFILESATTEIKLTTKLQGMDLEVGSVVDLSHRKIFQRMNSTYTRKLGLVESVKKNGFRVEISMVDLSNAFNRSCTINDLTTNWLNTDEDGRLYGGFYTDNYGLISNDPDSFGFNLIW